LQSCRRPKPLVASPWLTGDLADPGIALRRPDQNYSFTKLRPIGYTYYS
jgi:hypothetical protein